MAAFPTFELDHGAIAMDPHFAGVASELRALSRIDSNAAFNRYCSEACRLWHEHFPEAIAETSMKFDELLQRVSSGGANVIKTDWGGVVITLHEHPRVEKFLVIREGGYLALEMHEQKDERLEVLDLFCGDGLTRTRLLSSRFDPAASSISSQAWSIASSAPRTCSSSSARLIRKEWIRI